MKQQPPKYWINWLGRTDEIQPTINGHFPFAWREIHARGTFHFVRCVFYISNLFLRSNLEIAKPSQLLGHRPRTPKTLLIPANHCRPKQQYPPPNQITATEPKPLATDLRPSPLHPIQSASPNQPETSATYIFSHAMWPQQLVRQHRPGASTFTPQSIGHSLAIFQPQPLTRKF